MMGIMLGYRLIATDSYTLTLGQLIAAIVCVVGAKLLLMIIKKVIDRRVERLHKAKGRFHSLYLIISYVVWVFAILTAMQMVGVQLNILLAGGAALMVGIGLGLQSVFNDLVSGIIILIEGTIEVNDIIQVDELIGKVTKISLRSSHVETQSDYSIIIPNHFFVSDKVVNWTHNKAPVRFSVDVGVAYGSDTAKVIKVLGECPKQFSEVSAHRPPFGRFEKFGDSSLDFKVFFWSDEPFGIDMLKSRIRLEIDKQFRANGITIPFPQRDVHLYQHPPG